jgi:hypothetical protein
MLAVRTKEFAIGGAILIFLMEYLCERNDVRSSIKKTAPFFVLFAIYSGFYLYYVLKTGMAHVSITNTSNVYTLDLNPVGIIANLWFYVSTLFYAKILGPAVFVAILAALFIGVWTSPESLRRIIHFAFAGFLLMLGPTLCLSLHRAPLYLYTSHFFAAMAIGALCNDWRKQPAFAIGLALTVLVLSTPTISSSKTYQITSALRNGGRARHQLESSLNALGPSLPPNTLVVISGVEKFFNPFASGPGYSLKIAYHDGSIQTAIGKPDQDLVRDFCEAGDRPRRYLAFEGVEAKDVTSRMAQACSTLDAIQ